MEPPLSLFDLVSCEEGRRTLEFQFISASGHPVDVALQAVCESSMPANTVSTVPLLDPSPPATDCSNDDFVLNGRRWVAPPSFFVDSSGSQLPSASVLSAFRASVSTWEDATETTLAGVVEAKKVPASGDGVNVVQFADLADSTTIAVAATFSIFGVIIDSDQTYNTDFTWSLTGEANRMDIQNIATHEFGHSFGLGHVTPTCLTTYAFASLGETSKRTLGDGDILGIRANYDPELPQACDPGIGVEPTCLGDPCADGSCEPCDEGGCDPCAEMDCDPCGGPGPNVNCNPDPCAEMDCDPCGGPGPNLNCDPDPCQLIAFCDPCDIRILDCEPGEASQGLPASESSVGFGRTEQTSVTLETSTALGAAENGSEGGQPA